MIILGFITAVASGVALPGHMVLFGRIINDFVFYSAATNCTVTNNGTVIPSLSMAVRQFLMPENITSCDFDYSCTDAYASRCNEFVQMNSSQILNRVVNRSSALLCSAEEGSGEDIFESVLDYVCCPSETLRDSIAEFSIIYVGMATAVLIVVFLATIFWNVSAYRQTKRMREAFYRSILYQDVGWFDVTEASELSTRLAE